jgi:hypothetical protein
MFVPLPSWIYDYGTVLQFEVQHCDASSIVPFAWDWFALQGLLYFHMNFRIDFSFSVKNEIEILVDIVLNM